MTRRSIATWAVVAATVLVAVTSVASVVQQIRRSPKNLSATPTFTLNAGTSWQQAFNQAGPGGIVAVNGGVYRADYPGEGAAKLQPVSGNPSVTFVCGDGQPVTFASPADQLVITAPNVTIRGSCFHLNRVWVGDGPNGVTTSNVVLDGVTMWSFNVAGSAGEIDNSTIGPDVACYAPGQAASCRNDPSTNEAYWYANGRGNTDYVEPMIHTLGPVNPHFALNNDRITQMQTRDSTAMHMSCLWVGYTPGGWVRLHAVTFDRCATDDIHVDTPQSADLTLDSSTLRHSVEPVQTGSAWDTETNVAQTELQVKCQTGQAVSGYTVTGNSFDHGWDLDFGGCAGVTFPGVTVTGNTGGVIRNPSQTGPTPVTTTAPVTTAPTTTAPAPGCALDAQFSTFQTSLYAGTLWQSYAKSNPREAQSVKAFLADTSTAAPSVATQTGKAFVAVGAMYRIGCP